MSQRTDSRGRMVASAATLLREQGLTGTSFGDVIEHSGAPRGSIYHHFPGGKDDLIEEAVRFAGDFVRGRIERSAETGDIRGLVRDFAELWRDQLVATDFRAGCPVTAVAVEAHDDSPQLASAAAEAFASWQSVLSSMLRRNGVPARRSERLARLVVAAIEGAIVLARAQRDTRPVDDVAAELDALLAAALG